LRRPYQRRLSNSRTNSDAGCNWYAASGELLATSHLAFLSSGNQRRPAGLIKGEHQQESVAPVATVSGEVNTQLHSRGHQSNNRLAVPHRFDRR